MLGINLENFRNLDSLSLEFGSDRIFFLGANGQGKTNLLEAIGICSNLRSFRGSSPESMVMDGHTLIIQTSYTFTRTFLSLMFMMLVLVIRNLNLDSSSLWQM